jgi:DNA polymerase-4
MRKIIHVDMDAFYAAVEQRDNPELKGRPVVVGGSPQSRSVVATASYEARPFGVRSAMPCAEAYRLCPRAVFVPPRFSVYQSVSRQIMEVMHEFTDLVEPLSLDEAYLDVTNNKLGIEYASKVAKMIKERIVEETQLTASAGVGPNKLIAKIASDYRKPNGLTVVPPEKIAEFIEPLSVRKLPGVGKVTQQKLEDLGIRTVKDLRELDKAELEERFGKSGSWYYNIARGTDYREVLVERRRKSVGCEDTFSVDLIDPEDIIRELSRLTTKVVERLGRAGVRGRTVTLKITYADFEKMTRSVSLDRDTAEKEVIEEALRTLQSRTELGQRPLRLLGVAISNLDNQPTPVPAPFVQAVQMEFGF